MLRTVEQSSGKSLSGAPKDAKSGERSLSLSSGRSLVVAGQEGREQIEIRSPEGTLELRIALTKEGPVLTLSGVKLEINSTDTVAVNCRDFKLATTGAIDLSSGGDIGLRTEGELRAKSMGQTHLDSSVLNLNSGDRSDYDDASLPKYEVPLPELPKLEDGGCGCHGGH